MSIQRAIAHRNDQRPQAVDCGIIDTIIADPQATLWLDIEDPTEEDLAMLREEFRFHELALEDALRRRQRPKVDEYEDYYFIVLYAASSSPSRAIETHEVHCFWGENYLVTLHEEPIPEIHAAVDRWASNASQHRLGVAYQMYALLDSLIDGYFPTVDALSDGIEDIEEQIFHANGNIIEEVFFLRKQLLDARRVLGPSRDVLNVLIRRDVPVFPPELVPYLADVYDHSIRVMDTLDLQRDLLSGAVDSYLSISSHRLNQTMRTMTALTIGLMVPTLIAGIYGMNFENIPELHFEWGYWEALLIMAISMGILYAFFWRIGWIGHRSQE
jgi:magnesium transporter